MYVAAKSSLRSEISLKSANETNFNYYLVTNSEETLSNFEDSYQSNNIITAYLNIILSHGFKMLKTVSSLNQIS